MILQIVGNDHFVVQSAPSGAPAWLKEEAILHRPPTMSMPSAPYLCELRRSSGPAVYLRFLMHGFGVSTGDGVYLDDFDVRCDTIAPGNPALSSTSHILGVASIDRNIVVNLTGGTDFSPLASGVAGYSYSLDTNPATEPDYVQDADTWLTTLTLPESPGGVLLPPAHGRRRRQSGRRRCTWARSWSSPSRPSACSRAKLSGDWAGSKYAGTVALTLTATEPMSVDVNSAARACARLTPSAVPTAAPVRAASRSRRARASGGSSCLSACSPERSRST